MKKSIVILFLVGFLAACSSVNWRTASREPAGIAVDPLKQKNAVIEVYAADAFSWRGWFAVHTFHGFRDSFRLVYNLLIAWL